MKLLAATSRESRDSFIIPTSQLKLIEFRFLEVDDRCILLLNYNTRILTIPTDVIHS